MIKIDHLQGIPFKEGSDDCFGLMRQFYSENFDVNMLDYARPEGWWRTAPDLDLYMKYFRAEGFESIDVHPRETAIGDGFLMMVLSKVVNHAAAYVGDGKILHHTYGRLSNVESYGSLWRRVTVVHLRHPKVFALIEAEKPKTLTKVDLMDLLPPGMRKILEPGIAEIQSSDRQ
ncbi:NlpC/P60 family protein [Telmatospirillum sp.]|uniref:NlpC/P60 family protein n=1 Tax=Telmatospirillum sp. TaxID=2079197 RepID=UPI002840397F|nr:NlpC/P60 family protein [Telmatospirillum sp.]MDR3436440.1 NlpC/P60 family protein [Telmatospirillum sp.]